MNTNIVANSTCYTPTTSTTATWLSAVYNYNAAAGTFVALDGQPKYASSQSTENFSRMITWFNSLMKDTFAWLSTASGEGVRPLQHTAPNETKVAPHR